MEVLASLVLRNILRPPLLAHPVIDERDHRVSPEDPHPERQITGAFDLGLTARLCRGPDDNGATEKEGGD